MTTKYVGKTGDVQINTVAVGGVKSWALDYEIDTAETTTFDDEGIAAYMGTILRFSGSFETYKTGAPLTIDGGLDSFYLQETSSAGQLWGGNLIITALHVTSSHDGLVTYSYDFQGSGALTIATA